MTKHVLSSTRLIHWNLHKLPAQHRVEPALRAVHERARTATGATQEASQKVQRKIKVRFIVKQQTLHTHQTGRLKRKGVRGSGPAPDRYGTAKVYITFTGMFSPFVQLFPKICSDTRSARSNLDRSTDLVRRRDANAPNNMYKNRKCKENTNRASAGGEAISASALPLHLFCSSGWVFKSTC